MPVFPVAARCRGARGDPIASPFLKATRDGEPRDRRAGRWARVCELSHQAGSVWLTYRAATALRLFYVRRPEPGSPPLTVRTLVERLSASPLNLRSVCAQSSCDPAR